MERTSKNILTLGALLVAVAGPLAQAGTILVPPPRENNARPDGEPYSESSFGRAPAPIEAGIRRGYASRAIVEMEEVEDRAPASRAPAGMLFDRGNGRVGKGVAQAPRSGNRSRITAMSERSPELDSSVSSASSSSERGAPAIRLPDASSVYRKGVQEVSIIAADLGYFPKAIFVTRDVPVRLFVTGASKNTLCIMMDSFGVRKQIRNQRIEEITFTPTTPGQYRFYCPVNGMEGTLVVRELMGASPPSDEAQASADAPANAPNRRVAAFDER